MAPLVARCVAPALALTQQNTLPQSNMVAPLKELRTALLEADVALPAVKALLARVEAAAAGVKARLRRHTRTRTCTP